MLFAKSTFVLLVVLSISIAMVHVAGSGGSRPVHVAASPPTCYLPCLLGILPGWTNTNDESRIIHELGTVTQCMGVYLCFTDSDGAQISFQLGDGSFPRQPVETLLRVDTEYNLHHQLTTLGDLISAGYSPTRVYRGFGGAPGYAGLFIVFNGKPTLMAYVGADVQLTANSPVTGLYVDSEARDPIYVMGPNVHSEEIRWYGYGSVDKYLDAPVIGPGY